MQIVLPIVANHIAPRIVGSPQIGPRLSHCHQSVAIVIGNQISSQDWLSVLLNHHPIFVFGNPVANHQRCGVLGDVNSPSRFLKQVISHIRLRVACNGDSVGSVVLKLVILNQRRAVAANGNTILGVLAKPIADDSRTTGFDPGAVATIVGIRHRHADEAGVIGCHNGDVPTFGGRLEDKSPAVNFDIVPPVAAIAPNGDPTFQAQGKCFSRLDAIFSRC